jgi:hypothetical protein
MGFEAEDTLTTYRLKFEEYPGLEVTAREPSVGQMMELNGTSGQDPQAAGPEKVEKAFQLFSSLLESWNITRKGKPVPATYEGVMSLGGAFVMKLVKALGDSVGAPDPTSPPASGSGPPAPDPLEASIPVTPASPPSS